jgi:hypothetical protein
VLWVFWTAFRSIDSVLWSGFLVVRSLSNFSKYYRAAGVILWGWYILYCSWNCATVPDAAAVLFAVNANRILPKFPTISVCQHTDKLLRTKLVSNALVVRWCTVPHKFLSVCFILMKNLWITVVVVCTELVGYNFVISIVAMFVLLDIKNSLIIECCHIHIQSPYPISLASLQRSITHRHQTASCQTHNAKCLSKCNTLHSLQTVWLYIVHTVHVDIQLAKLRPTPYTVQLLRYLYYNMTRNYFHVGLPTNRISHTLHCSYCACRYTISNTHTNTVHSTAT